MKNIALVGDSIFDNNRYVKDGHSVIAILKKMLPPDYQARLLAKDGAITSEVNWQLIHITDDTSHLFISAGGNDALRAINLFNQSVNSIREAMQSFTEILDTFQHNYQNLLKAARQRVSNVCVCTVYDSIPDMENSVITLLSMFNAVILKEAFALGVPVIDLRLAFNQAADYSAVSPIEPSEQGGKKICELIEKVVTRYNFEVPKSNIVGCVMGS